MEQELEFFLMNDQPVTCPKCGNRTEFEEAQEFKCKQLVQKHKCLDIDCQFKFEVVLT